MTMPDLEDDEPEWEVEGIKDHRIQHGVTHYLVKWKDWPAEYNEWVPEPNMQNAPEVIREYRVTMGKRTRLGHESEASRGAAHRRRGRPRKKT